MKHYMGNALMLLALVTGAAARAETGSALKEIDSLLKGGRSAAACKAIGDTANEFANLADEAPESHEALVAKLVARYQSAQCARAVTILIPRETVASRNDTIRWWESLSTNERSELRGGGAEANGTTRLVAPVITPTIQIGDPQGQGRRAERMRELRERDAANHEVARERREREREVIASPVSSPETLTSDLDY